MWRIALSILLSLPALEPQASPEQESELRLAKVRRIYVDILTGGESALKIRDLLMNSLDNSKLFIVTEDETKADAILKGTGKDEIFTESFSSSDGVNARVNTGIGNSQSNSKRSYGGLSIGESESRRTEERKHEAIATVRLVSKDGDVIWSTTEESHGGKFMGAAADVADKVTKKLAVDYKKAQLKTAK